VDYSRLSIITLSPGKLDRQMMLAAIDVDKTNLERGYITFICVEMLTNKAPKNDVVPRNHKR
jgi:hypothetical protein